MTSLTRVQCLWLSLVLLLHYTCNAQDQGGVSNDADDLSESIIQSIAAAVEEVKVRRASGDTQAGATTSIKSSCPYSAHSNEEGTSGCPFKSLRFGAVWQHANIFESSNPERIQNITKRSEIILATERNFRAITGLALNSVLASDTTLKEIYRRHIKPYCPPDTLPVCNPNAKYRTADGTCNNLANPLWGSSFQPHRRLLPPDYEDDPDNNFLTCCPDVPSNDPDCFPIRVPPGDSRRTNCMTFVCSTPLMKQPGPREQMNELTSYLDASSVYGSNQFQQNNLRDGGRLAVSSDNLLPPENNEVARCMLKSPARYCFRAGDARNTETVLLATNHIYFVREHNRIAMILEVLNPHWDNETVFQETKKIITAVLQHITYSEYVPIMLGPSLTAQFGLKPSKNGFRNVYSPDVDATVTNSFATASFRYAHSQITRRFKRINSKSNVIENEPLETAFDKPRAIFEPNGLDDLTRYLIRDTQPLDDRKIEDSVRQSLFVDVAGDAFDLPALNIQRGRDHGLPSYNRWRRFCKLPTAYRFDGLQDHDKEARRLLRLVYRHPNDIDLFTGALTEKHVPGALIGPTFGCLLANQFPDSQKGDRFYYENFSPITGFSLDQLNEIKQIRLSSVICANTNIKSVQSDVFRPPSKRNPLKWCNRHPQINLKFWKE